MLFAKRSLPFSFPQRIILPGPPERHVVRDADGPRIRGGPSNNMHAAPSSEWEWSESSRTYEPRQQLFYDRYSSPTTDEGTVATVTIGFAANTNAGSHPQVRRITARRTLNGVRIGSSAVCFTWRSMRPLRTEPAKCLIRMHTRTL